MKTLQRTLSIIKPDAVERGAAGDIIHTLLENKFRIIGMKMLHINKAQAEGFYAVHVNRPFFESLTNFMSSGPVIVMALEKRRRHRRLSQADGRHRSGQGRRGHHPQEVGCEHREERGARLRCRRHRALRDQLFLRRIRAGEVNWQQIFHHANSTEGREVPNRLVAKSRSG
jgi:nucleoside-diphosphate kinase